MGQDEEPRDGRRSVATTRFAMPQRDARALLNDKSGAVMVIGLGMAVICVGVLYYLAGVGDAVVYRERVQDGADVGAYAAATVSARGMNMIVVLNLISAICIAILLTLRVVQAIAIAGIAIASVVSALCFGCASFAIPPLQAVQQAANTAFNSLKPIMQAINKGCYFAQQGLKYSWPVVAQGRSIEAMSFRRDIYEHSVAGATWPLYPTTAFGYKEEGLPTEDDELWVLCERGGEFVEDAVRVPFNEIPVIGGKLGSFIGGAARGIASLFYVFFCGNPPASFYPDGFNPGPPPTVDKTESFPNDPFRNACNSGCDRADTSLSLCAPCQPNTSAAGCPDALERVCTRAAENEASRSPIQCATGPDGPDADDRPDPNVDDDGNCREEIERPGGCHGLSAPGVDGDTAECRRMSNQAASKCLADGERFDEFVFRSEWRYRVYFKVVEGEECRIEFFDSQDAGSGSTDTPEEAAEGRYHREEDRMRPPRETGLFFMGSCNNNIRGPFPSYCDYEDDDDDLPLTPPGLGSLVTGCTSLPDERTAKRDFRTVSTTPSRGSEGTGYVRRRVVNEIYQCSRTIEEPLDVGDTGAPGGSGEWKKPARLHVELRLGDNDFQFRSFQYGDPPPTLGDRGVQFANLWSPPPPPGDGEPGGGFETMSQYTRFSVAQAEYYWQDNSFGWAMSDHTPDKDGAEYMWFMGWTARMRRTSISPIFDSGGRAGVEGAVGGLGGGDGPGFLGLLNNLVMH